MIGGVSRHILPHLPGKPHLHVNRPLDRRSWLFHTSYFNNRWSAQIVHTFFNRIFHPGVSHIICTKRPQAGFPELPPTRTKLIPWTLNLYPASRDFFLARFMCGVVRVDIIRVVGSFTSPNENADGNFSVVEMRRLKTVQNNFYLMDESGIQLQIFA